MNNETRAGGEKTTDETLPEIPAADVEGDEEDLGEEEAEAA